MEWTHKLYKQYSDRFIYRLAHTGIKPNQITIFNFFFTLIGGCYLFAQGTWICNILALGVMFINVVLDYMDGDLAKKTHRISPVGEWLDKGGDIVLQISIVAAIAFGLWRVSERSTLLLPAATMFYFVGKNASNAVAFQYNSVFGFDSYEGNALFRKYMDMKPTLLNRALKNIIDPTSSGIGLALFTIRYWVIAGALGNFMLIAFYSITLLLTFQWVSMYVIYALYLAEYKKLWVVQALAILDENTKEFYKCRLTQ